MAVNTTAMVRTNPVDDYNFLIMGAMGIDIRADYNGKAGVFYSTDIDSDDHYDGPAHPAVLCDHPSEG